MSDEGLQEINYVNGTENKWKLILFLWNLPGHGELLKKK